VRRYTVFLDPGLEFEAEGFEFQLPQLRESPQDLFGQRAR